MFPLLCEVEIAKILTEQIHHTNLYSDDFCKGSYKSYICAKNIYIVIKLNK